MKALDKWWEPDSEVYCYECGCYCKEDAESVWRAALEWALSTETYVGSVAENIEDELGLDK